MSDDSCLVAKLSHYSHLSRSDRALLARLEENEEEHERGSEFLRHGDPVDHLYVVKAGWLYSYHDLPDGRRQITRIHHPGDVIGQADLPFRNVTGTTRACIDVCICPFPKTALDEVFATSPRLAALFYALSARDQVIYLDMLRAMGRMNARERMAHFLLDLLARLRVTNSMLTDTFRLPLTQSEIGDALGLTSVYVSKTLTAMEQIGDIKRVGVMIRIVEEARLAEACDFEDRYREMNTSWFPAETVDAV